MDLTSADRLHPRVPVPPPHVLERPPWRSRHPVVVDSNVLIEDVLRRTRTDFSALTFVASQKFATLVAPTHVDCEVREHLPEVAARTARSVEIAMHVYETVHRPLIRFVDLPDSSSDARVRAVEQRDRDDAPLAHLATMLAPAVALTRDHHLTLEGIGQSDWLETIVLVKQLAELDALIWGGSQAAWLGVALPAAAVTSLGRQLMKSDIALGACLGIAVGAALYLRPQLRAGASQVWTQVAPGLRRLMEATAQGFERREQADEALSSRLVTVSAPSTAEQASARLLAERWDPMPSLQIHAELARRGHEISLTATRTLLRGHPSFVAVPGNGFQLGRTLSSKLK